MDAPVVSALKLMGESVGRRLSFSVCFAARFRPGNGQMRAALCFAAACLAVPLHGHGLRASALTPSREIDLIPLGAHIGRPWLYHLTLFLDRDTLAVGFVARNTQTPRLARRGEAAGSSPFMLKVALVNVATGEVVRQAAYPTRSAHSGLLAAQGPGLLVLLGNWVCLCDAHLALVRKLELPRTSEAGWLARVSPSGRNVLLIQDTGFDRGTWAWLDIPNLRLERVWNITRPSPPDVYISDDYVAFRNCEGSEPPLPCTLVVQGRRDGRTAFRRGTVYGLGFHFTSDTLLFTRLLPLPPVGFSVVSLGDGRVRVRSDPSLNGFVVGSPAAAAGTDRFVVPVLDHARQPEYIYVFDGAFPHWRALRIRARQRFQWPWAVATSPRWLALSPDGSLLAVMPNFQTVLIYKLPPAKRH